MSSAPDAVEPRSKSALIEELLELAGAAMCDTATQDATEAGIARLLSGGGGGGGSGTCQMMQSLHQKQRFFYHCSTMHAQQTLAGRKSAML